MPANDQPHQIDYSFVDVPDSPETDTPAKWERAIAVLIVEPTLTGAAERIGVGLTTLRRWMRHPDFDRMYREARREVFNQSMRIALSALAESLVALRSIALDEQQPARARVAACQAILEYARHTIQTEEVEARIVALEQMTRQRSGAA